MKRKTTPKRRMHTPEDRYAAAKAHIELKNLPKVAELLDIPVSTVRTWRYDNEKEWEENTEKARKELHEQRRGQLTRIIGKSLDALEERIEKGDERVSTKSGRKIRVKVAAKEASIIAATMIDKLRLLEGKTEGQPQSDDTYETKMKQLRELGQSMAAGIQSGQVADLSAHKAKTGGGK